LPNSIDLCIDSDQTVGNETLQQDRAHFALASGHPSEEAGALVGYSAANSRRNARRGDVVARVGELRAPAQAKIAERLEITLESLIERAVNLYERCLHNKTYGPAVSALKEIGIRCLSFRY
jgi:hypothetical protein